MASRSSIECPEACTSNALECIAESRRSPDTAANAYDHAHDRQKLSLENLHEALDNWSAQCVNWASLAKLARSDDPSHRETFRALRLNSVLESALENTPDESAARPYLSLGRWWWEYDADLAYGEHPGCDTLHAQEGNRRLVRTLVAACEGLTDRHGADREAIETLVGLRALVAVALGPSGADVLEHPIDPNFVFDVLEREGGVDRARFLLSRLLRLPGRAIDRKFARFRQPGAPAIDGWPAARRAAFAAATRALGSSLNLTLDGLLQRFGVPTSTRTSRAQAEQLAAAEQHLEACRAVLYGDVTAAARALLENRTPQLSLHRFERLERLFFERFFFRPAASTVVLRDEEAVGLLDELDLDETASRILDDTNFFFSWALLPGVGELSGGRFVAWNTLSVFCYAASQRPSREFARHARTLLRVVCLQWPTWTGTFDPDALSTNDLQPVIDGLSHDCGSDSFLATLAIAGLESSPARGVRAKTTRAKKRSTGVGNSDRRL